MTTATVARKALEAKACNLSDAQLLSAAAEIDAKLAAARKAGRADDERTYTAIAIALNHAADRWIHPHKYSEQFEARIDAKLDAGLTYVRAVYEAAYGN